ncbi:hypothetical protein CK203_008027 [Vitis vinifera]|uniref:Uncharacterized protein n=1 Tax=Vitis vinifera TaxID=29760 RepID=A0A438K1M9_VITVI|nr:hypothetical protein CK203_008027 [Vitis vinifera]
MEEAKTMKTPMSSSIKLDKDEKCKSIDSTMYRGMIASSPKRETIASRTQGKRLTKSSQLAQTEAPRVLPSCSFQTHYACT